MIGSVMGPGKYGKSLASAAPNGSSADEPRRRSRPEPSPAQRALGLLVRREHSRKELARKLEARGVDAEAAGAAVERMAVAGWQDDLRFALGLARMRAAGGHGPLRIRAELGTHDLSDAMIERAFVVLAEDGDDDWAANARRLVERRYGTGVPGDLPLRRKAADFLARRGFDGTTIRSATRFEALDD